MKAKVRAVREMQVAAGPRSEVISNRIRLKPLVWVLALCFALPAARAQPAKPPAKKRPALTGKKVVMIVAPKRFRDDELVEPRAILKMGGARYQKESVVRDGRIISADEPEAAEAFAKALIKALSKKE